MRRDNSVETSHFARVAGSGHHLGSRLRDLRKRLELTQDQLAERGAFRDRTAIALIENGHTSGNSAGTRQRLAVGLGLTLDQVYAYFDGTLSLDDAASASSVKRG